MSQITFDEYQQGAASTAIYPKRIIILPNDWKEGDPVPDPVPNVYYSALGASGETGEVANNIKKIMRDSGGVITDEVRGKVRKELGDELWYVSEQANVFGIKLSEIAQENLDKLRSRQERGVLQGSGDNR